MKLYYAPSVCSLAVRIIVHELNISCEYEAVDLKSKISENGDNYLSINPKGSVECPKPAAPAGRKMLATHVASAGCKWGYENPNNKIPRNIKVSLRCLMLKYRPSG